MLSTSVVRLRCSVTSCTCAPLVYRICLNVCLFVSPWTSWLATSPEKHSAHLCVNEPWLWMSFYCTRMFVVHVSAVYFDYLCRFCYLFCRVVPLLILIVCMTRIAWYSSTRDLLGLAAALGWLSSRGFHSPEAVHLWWGWSAVTHGWGASQPWSLSINVNVLDVLTCLSRYLYYSCLYLLVNSWLTRVRGATRFLGISRGCSSPEAVHLWRVSICIVVQVVYLWLTQMTHGCSLP